MRNAAHGIDARVVEHRRRSTSIAGMVAGLLALGLFEYDLLFEHVFKWELLSIGLAFALIRLVGMLYYVRQDKPAAPRMRKRPYGNPGNVLHE